MFFSDNLSFISLIICFTSSDVSLTCKIVSLSVVILFKHLPKYSILTKSKSSPRSSFIIVAPVSKDKSSSSCFLFTPYVGASTTLTFILPFILFIARADKTPFSKSPIISKGLLFFITYSSTVCICLIVSTLDSINSTNGFSSSAEAVSAFVMKCLFVSPLSYCEPSITSTSVLPIGEGSIITTPVRSTALKASAISLPNSGSLLVDIVAI